MSTDQPIPQPSPSTSTPLPNAESQTMTSGRSASSKNLLGLGLPASTTTPSNPSSLTPNTSATPRSTHESTLHQYPHLGHYIFQLISSLHSSPPRQSGQHPLAVSSSGESDDENTPPVSRDDTLNGSSNGILGSSLSSSSGNGDKLPDETDSYASSTSGSEHGAGTAGHNAADARNHHYSGSQPGSRRVSKVEVDKDALVRRIVQLLDEEMEEEVKDILRPMMGELGKDDILMEQVCLDCMHKRRDDQEHVPYQSHLTPTRPRMSPQVSSTILRPYTPTRLPSFRARTPLGRPQSPVPGGALTPTASNVGGLTRTESNSRLSIGAPGSATTSPSAVPGTLLPNAGGLSAKASAFNPSPRMASATIGNSSLSALPLSAKSSIFSPSAADPWKDAPPEPPRTASPFGGAHGMVRTGSNRAITPLFSDQSSPFHSPLGTPNRSTLKLPDVFASPSPSHTQVRPTAAFQRTNSSKDIIPDDDDDDEFSPFGRGLPKLHHHNEAGMPALNSSAKPFEPMGPGRIDNADHFGSSSTLSSSIPRSDSSRESFDSGSNSSTNLALPDEVEAGAGMTPLDVLHSVFTTIPRVELEQALHQSGYDFESAMATLVSQYTLPRSGSSTPGRVASPRLVMGVGARGPVVSGHNAPAGGYFDRGGRGLPPVAPNMGQMGGHGLGPRTPGGVRMCRYFLAGECRRSDCRFSHDLDRALCRFWLRGNCAKGPNCEFLHQLPPNFQSSFDPHALSSAMSRLELSHDGSYHNSPPARGEEFPDLMGGRFRPAARFDPSRNRFANALKRPVVPHPAANQSGYIQVTGSRMGINPPASIPIGNGEPSPLNNTIALPRQSTRIKLRPPTLLPTLQTGTAANDQYMSSRQSAIRLGHARNSCLARAADAFRRGDGAAAKRFSREGKSLNEKMVAESADAAVKLVKQRQMDAARAVRERDGNWSDDPMDRSERGKAAGGGLGVVMGVASRRGAIGGEVLSADERMEVLLDLHTLHGNEGADVVAQFLSDLDRENYRGLTYVLIGEEKHVGQQDPLRGTSKVRLGSSVKSYLGEWGYAWMEGSGWICVDSCR